VYFQVGKSALLPCSYCKKKQRQISTSHDFLQTILLCLWQITGTLLIFFFFSTWLIMCLLRNTCMRFFMTLFAHLFGFYVWNWVWTWDILTSQLLAIINQTCLLPTSTHPSPQHPNHTCLQLSTENVFQLRKHCCWLFDSAPFWHYDELIVAYLAQVFRAFSGIRTVHYSFHRSPSLVVMTEQKYFVSSRTVLTCICLRSRLFRMTLGVVPHYTW
jgi:hypothetical protein